jgi:DNA-binding SARP family transcriptional activator
MARFRLRTFGGLTLESANTGAPVPMGRRPLGLLAILATAGARGLSRDKVTALLWPERDTDRSRNSLSQVLSALRRDLGAEDLVVGTSEIRLNPNAIDSDVTEFELSLEGNRERAATLYVGPFLDGVFLTDAPGFERWVEDRRSHLHAQQRSVLQHLAEDATRRNDCTVAICWWRRLAAHDPASARAAIGLMEALAASGDRAAALQHFREYRRVLEHELGAEPEAGVVAVAERLRRGEGDVTPPVVSRSFGVAPVAEPPHALTLGSEGSPIDRQLDPVASMAIKASPYQSRRRVATKGFYVVAALVGIAVAVIWLRAAGVRPFGSLLSAGSLGTNAPLIVADFKTTGPDTALSGPLAEAMRTSLGQSRVVTIVPISRIVSALRLMRRDPDSRLDVPLACEVAQREGVKAVVASTLTSLNGGGYLLSTKLVMASSGDELAAFQTTVDGTKDLLPAIDRLARKLRERIGESMELVRADPPLAQVTTGSLEALKKYSAAMQVNAQGDYARALALLQDAIGIDSTFAMAYRQLILSTGNSRMARIGLGGFPDQSEVWVRASAKLYALRDRLPERERLEAVVSYLGSVVGDWNKVLIVSDTLLSEFPNAPGVVNSLAMFPLNRREFARAESLLARAITSEPTTPFAYFNIVLAQIGQGKYDAAKLSFDRARRHFPKVNDARITEIFYYLGRIDSVEAMARAQAMDSIALNRLGAHNTFSILAARGGRIREARMHLAAARALERERGEPSRPLDDSLLAAQFEIVFFKHPAAAVRILDRALAETPLEAIGWIQSRPYLRIASLYAQADRADKAKAMLAAYDRAVSDTAQRRRDQPGHDSALAYVALAERRPRDAAAAFRRSDMRADGGHGDQCAVCVDPGIGLAFDRAGMTDSAIAALEHFVNAPSLRRKVVDAWDLHWVLRRLGELHEARGDSTDAVKYYRMFVELWKSADPALQPGVTEVKQRLARLSKN